MDRINSVRLYQALRALGRSSAVTGTQAHRSADDAPADDAQSVEIAALKRQIVQRLTTLDERDPSFSHDAAVIVVQEVLQWQFGRAVLAHADFQQVVDGVVEAIQQHPQLGALVQQVVADARRR